MSETVNAFVLPLDGPPLEDTDLEDALQAMLAGVTGIPGDLVRPLWQPLPLAQPAATVDWAAIGVTGQTPDTYGYVAHDPNGSGGLGNDVQQRHEDIMVLATFYGPRAQGYAQRVVLGLAIEQNRELLGRVGIRIKSVGAPRNAPDLVNFQFIRRVDLEISMRRCVTIAYPIRTILSATGNDSPDTQHLPDYNITE